MKYIFLSITAILLMTSVALAHNTEVKGEETVIEKRSEVVDYVFHGIVFGGLIAAGINGVIQNKKATGKYIVL